MPCLHAGEVLPEYFWIVDLQQIWRRRSCASCLLVRDNSLALASCTGAMNSGDCAVCVGIKSIQAAFNLIKRISNLDVNMRNSVFCLLCLGELGSLYKYTLVDPFRKNFFSVFLK